MTSFGRRSMRPEEPLQLLDRKFSRQFRLEQARAFVWGQQPTLANFLPSQLEDRAEEMAYVFGLARIRQRALKYLLHGTFLRPPIVQSPEDELDISRLSIYAGQRGELSSYRKRAPQLLAAAYLAPDGDVGIALASLTARAQTVRLKTVPREAERVNSAAADTQSDEVQRTVRCWLDELPKQGQLWQIDEQGRSLIGRFLQDGSDWTVSLPSCGACVIEIEAD